MSDPINVQQALQRLEQPQTKKSQWQRNHRRNFAASRGYSTSADYGCGGMREAVLVRDGRKCVKCGMTDGEHKEVYGRPITIDHKDRNRRNNAMENLQTMCLECHGRKDLLARLRVRVVETRRTEILTMRGEGYTFQAIADAFGFSIAAVWKWVRLWEKEAA